VNFPYRSVLLACILLLAKSLLFAQGASAPAPQNDAYCQQISHGIEHADVLEKFCNWASSLSKTIPNFMGEQKTLRSEQIEHYSYRQLGSVSAKVAYEDGNVHYSDIKVNERPFSGTMDQVPGAWSVGEFGREIVALFLPNQPAEYHFVKLDRGLAKGTYLFEMKVSSTDNRSWNLTFGAAPNRKFAHPAFVAHFWLMPGDGQLVRIEHETTEVPKDFPIRWSMKTSNYSDTELGDGTRFVLPTSDLTLLCYLGKNMGCSRNELQFSHWHKFTATHRILSDTPAANDQ
jgi:hypothetical protein